MSHSPISDALTNLFHTRAPHQEKLRASLGNGQGVVAHPTLADHVYCRIRGAQPSVVIAHNIQVPSVNDLAVDIERDTTHNQTNYRVIGLTEGIDLYVGGQPYANVSLHGYSHGAGGYDPIIPTHKFVFTSVDYTATSANDVVLVDTSAGARNVFLLDAGTFPSGYVVTVKDYTGQAAGSNITVSGSGSQLVDNQANVKIITAYGALRLMTDTHNWFSI